MPPRSRACSASQTATIPPADARIVVPHVTLNTAALAVALAAAQLAATERLERGALRQVTAAATLAAADDVAGVRARAAGAAFSAAVAAAAPAGVLLGALPQLVRLLLPCFVQGLEAQPVGRCDLRPSMSPDTSESAVCAVYSVFFGRSLVHSCEQAKML